MADEAAKMGCDSPMSLEELDGDQVQQDIADLNTLLFVRDNNILPWNEVTIECFVRSQVVREKL